MSKMGHVFEASIRPNNLEDGTGGGAVSCSVDTNYNDRNSDSDLSIAISSSNRPPAPLLGHFSYVAPVLSMGSFSANTEALRSPMQYTWSPRGRDSTLMPQQRQYHHHQPLVAASSSNAPRNVEQEGPSHINDIEEPLLDNSPLSSFKGSTSQQGDGQSPPASGLLSTTSFKAACSDQDWFDHGATSFLHHQNLSLITVSGAGDFGLLSDSLLKPVTSLPQGRDAGSLHAVVIGFINAMVNLPALIAYTTIVFQAPVYSPFIGPLCKFLFLSSAIHQAVVCTFGTLPFTVGQVQDVGLIFLSAMATDIACTCSEAGLEPKVALGTSLLALSIATATAGALTVGVGKFQLAQLLQYIPLPVIGGYLAYVGYFCFSGGASLAAGVELNEVVQWLNVLKPDPLIKLTALAGTTFMFMWVMHRFHHPLVLPAALAAVPLVFHLVLIASGLDLEQAQEAGWVMKPTEGSSYQFWELWQLFNIDPQTGWAGLVNGGSIYWPALFRQLPKIPGLFLVICFGSCMDVAAIQQEYPQPIDFNQQLVTIGTSNILSGILGAGFTGSYIFSQSIFTLRARVHNRFNGWTIVILELALCMVPFSVAQYCPSFFFGALLAWFGSDIFISWMFLSYWKLSKAEYFLLLLSFMSIMYVGLQLGIVAGIIMAVLYFVYEYAKSTTKTLNSVPVRSGTVRRYSHRTLLDVLVPAHVAALELSGFLFFGNSIAISSRIEKIAEALLKSKEEISNVQVSDWRTSDVPADDSGGKSIAYDEKKSAVHAWPPTPTAAPYAGCGCQQAPALVGGSTSTLPTKTGIIGGSTSTLPTNKTDIIGGTLSDRLRSHHHLIHQSWALEAARDMIGTPLFLIIDLSDVPSMDATAAHTFAMLCNVLFSRGIQMIICGIQGSESSDIKGLLVAQGMSLIPYPDAVGYEDYSVNASSSTPPAVRNMTKAKECSESGGCSSERMAGFSSRSEATSAVGTQHGLDAPLLATETWQYPEESVAIMQSPPVLQAGQAWEFASFQSASQFCEERLLLVAVTQGLVEEAALKVSLEEVVTTHSNTVPSSMALDLQPVIATLRSHMISRILHRGELLFRAGEAVGSIFLIESGYIKTIMASSSTSLTESSSTHLAAKRCNQQTVGTAACASLGSYSLCEVTTCHGSHIATRTVSGGGITYGPGSLLGLPHFYMDKLSTVSAVCQARSCCVLELTSESLERLMVVSPASYGLMQMVAAKYLSIALSEAGACR
ncbi:hypothetical protein CEUSTIGMA_g5779.t1 [Chlamydomonas eustigma]|uniref:STAS domain-containing protein n=1 Tax=Chlamydomonas eustigma TaxID=1157962 RepID=A0A250X5H2_9CHLO|nr:hypothetical protein CEUSTIGMA_g5779.t1 [Chlamydomonas eustigma]|eukprot:GAX78337.1 hypothetical protein CEUSTIGMA_g5779.t1 [Chlamydomonas eustigma]